LCFISITNLNIFGVKYDMQIGNRDKAQRLIEMLKLKKQYGTLTVTSTLRTLPCVGLDEEVEEGFSGAVEKSKRKSLVGIGLSAGLGALVYLTDLPNAAEVAGYISAAAFGLTNVLNYARASVADMYVRTCLNRDCS
jgi:hypothetical protein